jgi:hypothetical protein
MTPVTSELSGVSGLGLGGVSGRVRSVITMGFPDILPRGCAAGWGLQCG